MIYRNPYYVNKDPLKAIFFDGNDGSGKPMIYRNPFVPGAIVVQENWTENIPLFVFQPVKHEKAI